VFGEKMKIIEFKFDPMPDSAQFCTDTVIYAFHEVGFIEFRAYCMINSLAQPVNIEIVEIGENRYMCHVLTVCELTAMSEKCILLKGKLECKEVNEQMQMTVRQRIVEDQ
jgi:hypothetical protein